MKSTIKTWLPLLAAIILAWGGPAGAKEKKEENAPAGEPLSALINAAETAGLDEKSNPQAELKDFAGKPLETLLLEIEICNKDGKTVLYAAQKQDWQIIIPLSFPLSNKRGAALQVDGVIEKATAHAAGKNNGKTLLIQFSDFKSGKPKRTTSAGSSSGMANRTLNDISRIADLYRRLPENLRPQIPLPIECAFAKIEEKVDSTYKADGRRRLELRLKNNDWRYAISAPIGSDINKGDIVKITKSKIAEIKISPTPAGSDYPGTVTLKLEESNISVSEKRAKQKSTSIKEDFDRMRGNKQ